MIIMTRTISILYIRNVEKINFFYNQFTSRFRRIYFETIEGLFSRENKVDSQVFPWLLAITLYLNSCLQVWLINLLFAPHLIWPGKINTT